MAMIEFLKRRTRRLLWQAKLARTRMVEALGEMLSAHEVLANDLEHCRLLQTVPVRVRSRRRG